MWTLEKIQKEALKYKTRAEFRKYDNPAYQAAKRKKLLDKVCKHMTPVYTSWTNEQLEKEALKYKTRVEFQKNNCAAYHAAQRRKILDKICAHMESKITNWTIELLREEALKYKTRGEFQNKNAGAYMSALRSGTLDEICKHMEFVHNNWTKEKIEEEALKYKFRADFYNKSPQAYRSAIRNRILDKVCSHMIYVGSAPQVEIYDFIKQFYKDSIINTKSIITPFELDIYIPELNLAIEYCGLYRHSEEFKKNKNYHYDKMKICNEKGIRLITIFEDEWKERNKQVKGFLLSVIKKNTISIGARKLGLKRVGQKEGELFLEENHIQGKVGFIISFGIYKDDELLGLITGNKHHRQGFNDTLVLNRLVFRHGYTIQGGASKLSKALVNWAKQNNYSKIISWSDNRWSEGNVYLATGYSLAEELLPDYSYVHKNKRISKQSCQKKNLLKKGAIGNTEKEMAASLGYKRIWDCGKKRWVLDI